jgi:hypothetical protein
MCPNNMCISWILGVSSLGTTKFISQTSFIVPPSRPEKPKVLQPSFCPNFKAFIIFLLFPLVLIPMIKSPLFASASTCLSKTLSYP